MNVVRHWVWVLVVVFWSSSVCGDGNRLHYLNGPLDPYYVDRDFARLTTPQWVGEADVDAVIVLAIDDMRDPVAYEKYLRPILDRLKQIDGRAPVSIMTSRADPNHQQLTKWIQEGLSVEVHTTDHPCPLLQGGDFQKAKQTYDQCVDLMGQIKGNQPVAFRMPCCDSMNTPSPRFWTEIFSKTTPNGNFLYLDSSVFNITTNADTRLARQITTDAAERPRFRKYLPFPSFVNTIEDYPFPYVIGNDCWEFPCIVPSDWEAQNLHRPNNPQTVTDMKRALDAVVAKQGVYDLVFHPHGWIRSDQVVDLIDYSVDKFGERVKFLTFREAHDRLSRHLLNGRALRDEVGRDAGVRILDVNGDGWMDVLLPGADGTVTTRVWLKEQGKWSESQQRLPIANAQYGVTHANAASFLAVDGHVINLFTFADAGWQAESLAVDPSGVDPAWLRRIHKPSAGLAMKLHDVDADGCCELLLHEGAASLILRLNPQREWQPLPFQLPHRIRLSTSSENAAWRLVDIDSDRRNDILFSDPNHYAVYLFKSMDLGWSKIIDQDRRIADSGGKAIPTLVRADGTNNGAWIHSGYVWFQNEDTDRLPDKVDRVSFEELMAGQESGQESGQE